MNRFRMKPRNPSAHALKMPPKHFLSLQQPQPNNPMSLKLTDADKAEIVRLWESGELLQKEIAAMFRVSPPTVNRAIAENLANKRDAALARRVA
jgi:predicted DNA-binding protein (UPF0251 family)